MMTYSGSRRNWHHHSQSPSQTLPLAGPCAWRRALGSPHKTWAGEASSNTQKSINGNKEFRVAVVSCLIVIARLLGESRCISITASRAAFQRATVEQY